LAYGKPAAQIFLGKEIAQHRDYSEATAAKIDEQIKKIVMSCYDEAHRILEERAETLTCVAEALLVHETLTADQIATLVRGEELPPTVEPSVDGQELDEDAGLEREVGKGPGMFREPGLRPA